MSKDFHAETIQGKLSLNSLLHDAFEWLKSVNNPLTKAAKKFRPNLPDFYISLADRIENAKGMNFVTMFERDAIRYNVDQAGKPIKTPRGTLSKHWAARIIDTGADLAQTFEGTLPREDIALIRMGASAGAGALPSTLRDLARISLLVSRAKAIFLKTSFVGVVALVVMIAILIITPTYTVPLLKSTFDLPLEYMPPIALRLYAFSDFIESYLLMIVGGVTALVYLLIWSLPNYTGRLRPTLDKYLIWGLYRDLQGALFLAVLSTMVKKRGNISDNLSVALKSMVVNTTPWRRWHINRMIDNLQNLDLSNLDNSAAITNALNTGIMDRESFFYLIDVQEGQGLAVGLAKAGDRVEGPTLTSVQRQASFISFVMLGSTLTVIAVWVSTHLSVASQIVAALKSFMSS